MTFYNKAKYNGSHWEFSVFDGCFGATKIKFMDLDGIVERHGHFLTMEWKRPGVRSYGIPTGQRITFEALQRIGVFTNLIVYGDTNFPDIPSPQYVYEMSEDGKRVEYQCDIEGLKKKVKDWFVSVN